MTKLSKPIVIWTGRLDKWGGAPRSDSNTGPVMPTRRFRVVITAEEAWPHIEISEGSDSLGVEAWVPADDSRLLSDFGKISLLKSLVSELTVKNIYERQQREAEPIAEERFKAHVNAHRRAIDADKATNPRPKASPQERKARHPKKGPRKG